MTPSQLDCPIRNKSIHNISSVHLSYKQIKLLGLGHKYIPQPPPMSKSDILKEYGAFSRSCRLRRYYRLSNEDSYDPFRLPNPLWEPPLHAPELDHALNSGLSTLHDIIDVTDFKSKPRFTRSQLVALRRLHRLLIVTKPTDKNLGLVVVDRDKYIAEGIRQLSNRNVYSPVASVPWISI